MSRISLSRLDWAAAILAVGLMLVPLLPYAANH